MGVIQLAYMPRLIACTIVNQSNGCLIEDLIIDVFSNEVVVQIYLSFYIL